jgi:hypothetical protein
MLVVAGVAVVTTVKEPGVPTVKVVAAALVYQGGSPTFNVNVCTALAPKPLVAVRVHT